MKITVDIRLLPMLSEVVGKDTFEIELTGATVKDLIEELIQKYGRKAKESLFNEGGFDTMIQISINGERWVSPHKLDTPLKEGDKVSFMILMGGG
jgi:MoaD family protein